MRAVAASKLAIAGGTPVRSSFLVFGAPCLGQEEIDEVIDVLRSGWIGTGTRAADFERSFADFVGVPHAVAVNSCTAGLYLCLSALGIGPGDEVITTPLTFVATVNVIEHLGARPVFADIDEHTLNLDPESVEAAICGVTRAVLPVHFGGLCCDWQRLSNLCQRQGVHLLEDAAHAVGARRDGRPAGAQGIAASFSFYANKNLTTAEGGMITTSDGALAETLRRLSNHGLDRSAWHRFTDRRKPDYDMPEPGFKFNMPDLAAALGLHQLAKQEAFLAVRERYAQRYDEAFAEMPFARQSHPATSRDHRHALHLYTLRLKPEAFRVSRDQFVEALLAENIGASVHYRPVPSYTYYRRKYGPQIAYLPHAYQVGSEIFSLPLTPGMAPGDVEDVIEAVQKVSEAYIA